MTAQQPETPLDRTVRLALTAGRHNATLDRVRALQEAWAAHLDPVAWHYALLLGEALDGPQPRELDYDAIHDHVADQEEDDA